jgi:hypothetical protein
MGLSETILAAIIGALATMGTAIFQLVRNRAPSETRPKKNRVRSTFAIVLLVAGAMVGGYFWSELRAVGAKEEIAALRADLKLAAREAAVSAAEATESTSGPVPGTDPGVTPARLGDAGSAESVAHLPPCRVTTQAEDAGPTACTETLASTVSVCAIVPASAHTTAIRVQARVPKSETPWLERNAGAATLGDLHIAAAATEYPASVDKRSVCLDVANWSVEDTLAVRVIVDYDLAPSPTSELTAAAPTGTTL